MSGKGSGAGAHPGGREAALSAREDARSSKAGRPRTAGRDKGGKPVDGGQCSSSSSSGCATASAASTPRVKAGQTKQMGGVTLVAVERDGRMCWEPENHAGSATSRDARQESERNEARWLKDMESKAQGARVREARSNVRSERERKTDLFDDSAVRRKQASLSRTSRVRTSESRLPYCSWRRPLSMR